MRRLVEDQGGLLVGERLQNFGARARLMGQEAGEVESVGGQAGAGQRGEGGGGAGDGHHGDLVENGSVHQPVAGVRNERRAGIRHQRDGFAR